MCTNGLFLRCKLNLERNLIDVNDNRNSSVRECAQRRYVVAVRDVTHEIVFVADLMFPEPPLPQCVFAARGAEDVTNSPNI